jgi:hypothetical protein
MDEKRGEDEEPSDDEWADGDPFILFEEWSSPADIAAFDSLAEKP